MFLGNFSYFVSHFREVLILAEQQHNVESISSSQSHDIQGNPYIDALFFGHFRREATTAFQRDFFAPPPERAGECDDTLSRHCQKLRGPEVVPERIVRLLWDSRIESSFEEHEAFRLADGVCKGQRRIVWVFVLKSLCGLMEEILTVEERDGSLCLRLAWHGQKITPPGPEGKSGGGQMHVPMHATIVNYDAEFKSFVLRLLQGFGRVLRQVFITC